MHSRKITPKGDKNSFVLMYVFINSYASFELVSKISRNILGFKVDPILIKQKMSTIAVKYNIMYSEKMIHFLAFAFTNANKQHEM